MMSPRLSVSTPASASLSSPVLGLRPMVVRTQSKSRLTGVLATTGTRSGSRKGDASSDTVTLPAPTTACFTVLPGRTVIFRFLASRIRTLLIATSTEGMGRSRSSPSTMVTSLPKERKMNPSSQPTTPPPTTSIRAGISVSSRASSLVSIYFPSAASPGRSRALEPVAIITLSPRISWTLPSGRTARTREASTTSPLPMTT